ncbi:MAG: dual specificity protein phosphatase family protein [Promethearchaeota archaeon]
MTETCGFYWVEKGSLAGSAYPEPCLEWLYHHKGIRAIVSLEPLSPSGVEKARQLGMEVVVVQIPDYTAGTSNQRNLALQAIDKFLQAQQPTLVHCYGGLGRTGMILALYLVKKENLPPQKAIKRIRKLRKGSIEANTGQEEAILSSKSGKCL